MRGNSEEFSEAANKLHLNLNFPVDETDENDQEIRSNKDGTRNLLKPFFLCQRVGPFALGTECH